jgi:uncharacterized protein (DUF849 family)
MFVDGIRIGLEDNLYFKDKVKTTNIDLLKRIHRIINEIGHKYMTPKDFQNLGYVNRKTNNIR